MHLFKGGHAMAIVAGECGPVERAEIEAQSGGQVAVTFFDDAGQHTVRRRYVVEQDTLYVPFRTHSGRAREAFERVDEATILRDYPCARSLLEQ